MKKLFFLGQIFFGLALVPTLFAIDATSKVTAVTVFNDRAVVERVSQVSLPVGESSVMISDIPLNVDRDTIRVSGVGSAKFSILGIDYRNKPISDSVSARANEISSKIENLQRQNESFNGQLQQIEIQRKLLKNIKLDASAGGSNSRPRNAIEMKEILDFVGKMGASLNQDVASVNLKIKSNDKEIAVLNRELIEINPGTFSNLALVVSVNSKIETRADLKVEYQISGARWRPTYNLYSTSTGDSVDLTLDSYGVISQQTGEDWQDVELTLSTARPALGIDRPEAYPLNLNIADVVALGGIPRRVNAKMLAPMAFDAATSAATSAMEMAEESVASVDSSYGALSFKSPKKSSVRSDGSEQKIKISSLKLTGSVKTVVVPYLSSEVYEEIRVVVPDAPLLPGSMRVINNGMFVGSREIPFIPKDGELQSPVGVASEVEVKRTQIKKFQDDPGIVRSFKRVTAQYEIEVKNLSSASKSVSVLERGVVSQNEKIKVTIAKVTPAMLGESDSARIAKGPGIWEWRLNLKPKETQKITYDVTVEAPADLNIPGLDTL
jgi:uncharacterized protein (TIGR02231 family)